MQSFSFQYFVEVDSKVSRLHIDWTSNMETQASQSKKNVYKFKDIRDRCQVVFFSQ
jgi:hypothetical protein